jgi:hypothetical protein
VLLTKSGFKVPRFQSFKVSSNPDAG